MNGLGGNAESGVGDNGAESGGDGGELRVEVDHRCVEGDQDVFVSLRGMGCQLALRWNRTKAGLATQVRVKFSPRMCGRRMSDNISSS